MSESKRLSIYLGDCLDVLKNVADSSIHSIVTDPPYGLKFMGKKWDCEVPSVQVWAECLRVLKPGGHLLAFAGTRTHHRMAAKIEDAGFEIRDMIAWVYGSGFPKSLDVSKAIDKAAGAAREVVGVRKQRGKPVKDSRFQKNTSASEVEKITTPESPQAVKWFGWGTALKPALEPITMARKPLTSIVSSNVLEHDTGAINVDGCRVGIEQRTFLSKGIRSGSHNMVGDTWDGDQGDKTVAGRWPANLIHDGSEEVVGLFPQSNGGAAPKKSLTRPGKHYGGGWGNIFRPERVEFGSGSAARFFYCAKASKADRGEENKHPTVKPNDLMRYLCRLVTPPNGIVLDPFMGSGSTGKAAIMEGFSFIGIERESEYVEIAKKRIGQEADLFVHTVEVIK